MLFFDLIAVHYLIVAVFPIAGPVGTFWLKKK